MSDIFDSPILVTGVTGYLGSHVAKQLLEAGRKVRGTVRNVNDTEKVELIKKTLCGDSDNTIELVAADLLKDDGWDKAVEGCSGILHVASPFPNITVLEVTEDDVVVPAREGTLRVLRAASKCPSVKKVVLTSSIAAVSGGLSKDKEFNEEDWSDVEKCDVYPKSKTIAERSAWDLVKELKDEDNKFELAVINPGLILGPPLFTWHSASTSIQIMADVLNKKFPALPKISMPCCDVRDVAKAHILALTNSDSTNNRHLIIAGTQWYKDWNDILSAEFKSQGYSFASMQAPYFAMWIYGCFNKTIRKNVLPLIGVEEKYDTKRMSEVLKLEPISLEQTVKDMAYAMIDLGIVKKTKNYKNPNSTDEETKDTEENQEKVEDIQSDVVIEELEPEDKPEKNELESNENENVKSS